MLRPTLLVLAVLAVASAEVISNRPTKGKIGEPRGPGFTRTYNGYGESGYYYDFTDYVPSLAVYSFDNMIRSACQTGLWFYYQQENYNVLPGTVYWMHGIEYCGDFPLEYSDSASSLRYAGSPFALNEDSFTLYQGELFTGNEFWGNGEFYNTLDYMDNDGSSLVLTGLSPWTFYEQEDFVGFALCVYPNTDHDVGADGTTLDFGIFINMSDLGVPDNFFSSVVKGCYSDKIVHAKPLDAINRSKHGAMGTLKG